MALEASRPKVLNFITSNPNKLKDTQAILTEEFLELKGSLTLTSLSLDLPELQGTVESISLDKCRHAAEFVNGPVLTEDTALEFKALNGLPGPYIKWFLESIGPVGLYKMLEPYDDKTITAVCTYAYCAGPGHEPILFQGRTDGKMVAARGQTSYGLGWDPIFEYEGRTYAEMDKAEKNKISHRYKALLKLRQWLAETTVPEFPVLYQK